MSFYVAGKLSADPGGVETPAPSDKVRKNAAKYLPLVENEELIMLVDATLLGSGKEGLAITNLRILRYEKSSLKLNLAFRGLQSVTFAELGHDSFGLEIVRSGQRSLKLKIPHAERPQIELIAAEIQARMKPSDEPKAAWTCPDCGPGEIIYIEQVRYTGTSTDATVALTANDVRICRNCGQGSLRVVEPSLIKPEAIDGAELRRSE